MTTHCNCNGNLIPSGNDFYLAVTLKSRSLVDGKVVETPFDFEAADTYDARIYGILDGTTLSTMVGLKDGTTDTVVIDAKGVPLIRAIGVEVTGEVDGRAFRAAEKGFLSIVEFNGEARVVFTPVTGGQEANLVMTLTFLPSAAVVGKNAYEIWKEEPGNHDKTLADFIYFLGHGESAYEIAVRYGYTGTEAEYNMLYFDAVDVANTAGQNAQQAADTANEMAAQAQDAAELADAATTNANNAATAAAATVDAAIDNMGDTLNAAIAAQDAEIASKEAEIDAEFATQTALINQKQLEIGAVPSDLTPTAGSTHWVTSGGIYNDCPSNLANTANADLDVVDEQSNVLVRFSDGHVKTKYFDSSNIVAENLSEDLKQEIENDVSVNNLADVNGLDITDEDGNIIARFENGNIRTKYFKSDEIQEDNLSEGLQEKLKKIVYNYIGHPSIYVPSSMDVSDLSVFPSLQSIYDAYDELASNYPMWFKREEDIGLDASETYPMRHYTLRMQYPLITDDRQGTDTNKWSDEVYHYRRILVQAGIHPAERYSILGCYLAIKEIIESNEDWAVFIKSNFIIDVLPCSNPWGAANDWVSVNVNDYNLNRTFFTNIQQENWNIINLITDLKQIGLIAIIDCHNTWNGESYFVSKRGYKYWNYYAVLTQKTQAALYDFTNTLFGTTRTNHFHLWDATGTNGQLHQYANSQNLLGGTFEVSNNIGLRGSIGTKTFLINLIQEFGTFIKY